MIFGFECSLTGRKAFEKVDQPGSGEDQKKGFMWRLTPQAIRDGVKSTTRYRSKVPNKRSSRSHHPAPQRQASGAKGGRQTRRTHNRQKVREARLSTLRNGTQVRSNPHSATCVPRSSGSNENVSMSDQVNADQNGSASPYYASSVGPEYISPSMYRPMSIITDYRHECATPQSSYTPSEVSFPGTPMSLPVYRPLTDEDCMPYLSGHSLFSNTPEPADGPTTPQSLPEYRSKFQVFEGQQGLGPLHWDLGNGVAGVGN